MSLVPDVDEVALATGQADAEAKASDVSLECHEQSFETAVP